MGISHILNMDFHARFSVRFDLFLNVKQEEKMNTSQSIAFLGGYEAEKKEEVVD